MASTWDTPRASAWCPPRILHAPADVAGNAFGLSRAERELGLRSDVAVIRAGRFGYGADIHLGAGDQGIVRRLGSRVAFMRRALQDYDIVHFNFGQTLFAWRMFGHVLSELPLFKRAGKTILVTFQGCDVRPWECCFCRLRHCRDEDRYRLPNAERLLRYADRCFHLNPDLRRWLPGSRFLPYSSVDPRALVPMGLPPAREELLVAHAPTDRAYKGTRHVLDAIRQLQLEGVPVRLDLIESVPHREVIPRLRDADVVVDQLNIGWYGGLSVEAMALGKPVLCHIREETPKDNPFGAELPIVRATAASLVARIRDLAGDRDARLRLGAAGRAFVERRHDPRLVAREVLAGIVDLPAPEPSSLSASATTGETAVRASSRPAPAAPPRRSASDTR
jgi:glycosyltransferase involved in cell wall biosynthesis